MKIYPNLNIFNYPSLIAITSFKCNTILTIVLLIPLPTDNYYQRHSDEYHEGDNNDSIDLRLSVAQICFIFLKRLDQTVVNKAVMAKKSGKITIILFGA
jgi:hypothetical protein